MIAVIADDFTGAAELAGLGLRFGLNVEIDSNGINKSNVDLLIIATDTRSMKSDEAYNLVSKIARKLKDFNVLWTYKKTDSVLRGNVLSELKALIDVLGKETVVLVPSNPAYGREIRNGIYYINDMPVHETGFSEDPEYSLKTSKVLDMLGSFENVSTYIITKKESSLKKGIAVAEASSIADLDYWIDAITDNVIPAGASGFFASLLKASGYKQKKLPIKSNIRYGKNILFVCGSAFSQGRIAVEEARLRGAKVCEMPDEVFYDKIPRDEHFQKWVDDTVNAFASSSKVIIEINQPVVKENGFAKRLRVDTARLVEQVMKKIKIDELFIDGGATTYAITKQLHLDKLLPCNEVAPGVIRMKVEDRDDFYITIKPGSYTWPEEILKLN
ncbi:MAG: four-carbon acid sugar kinase family protein [Ignavibacteriaceae bacterium]|mgnify:CR=1 FL=1|jgi:uncharacterized protein YgbK (DUF1537 family)|nr:four-carbon acid sugar kinase family protein [Ignavibacteriaceae bacterium]